MFKIIDFFGTGRHVYQSIKPIIDSNHLLVKGYIPVKCQVYTSNRLGEMLITTSDNFGRKKKEKLETLALRKPIYYTIAQMVNTRLFER